MVEGLRLGAGVLLDAMYGGEEQLIDWLEDDPARRLVVTSAATAARAEQFLEEVGDGDVRSRIRADRSPLGHMELVTGGKTIPAVLRGLP